jgi:arylsulfatase A-like enzyme
MDELKKQGVYDQTLITFNADHGMSGYEEKEATPEPAKALKEAGFHVARSQKELEPDTQIIVLSWGVRLVYFRKPLSDGDKDKVMQVLGGIQGAEVLDRKKLDDLGCHDNRSGDLIVSPLPGYTMSGAGGKGGQHGRFPERNPILFFHGPGFIQGTVDGAQTIDIVPTLLHLVNVAPAPTVDGKVIAAALKN